MVFEWKFEFKFKFGKKDPSSSSSAKKDQILPGSSSQPCFHVIITSDYIYNPKFPVEVRPVFEQPCGVALWTSFLPP